MGEKPKELTSFHYSCAGAFSGVVSRFVGQPLDVIKIRQQLYSQNKVCLKTASKQVLFLDYIEVDFFFFMVV